MVSNDESEVLSRDGAVFLPPVHIVNKSYFTEATYEALYKESIKDPEAFWARLAGEELHWFKKWDKVFNWNYPDYTWFEGGKLNISYNCLDRHVLNGKAEKIAYIYTNEEGEEEKVTYRGLLERVNRFANGLKSIGVQKGDRITIYMPLTIEQIVAMLACARIGAVHSVVYAGFSASALKLRIGDAHSKVVITSTYSKRRGKMLPLKPVVEEAVSDLDFVEKVIIHQRGEKSSLSEKQVDYYDFVAAQSSQMQAEPMDAEQALFILYTSGTTGKPKGVLHTTGGYNLFTHYTTKIAFDLKPEDVFWCTADTGWVTGHSYIVYGPLSNGATSLIYEGAPDYPDPGCWWALIEKYKVSKFYTAPTAVRLFMKFGEAWPAKYNLSSLKILGSVGEPINPEAWLWYYKNIGKGNCVVIDTWFQTETGGHILLSLPSCPQKPGRAGRPFFGIELDVVNKQGESLPPNTVGLLVIKKPWPSALRTCFGDPERYQQYWNELKGYYFAGDLATKDEEEYFMILGRADDVLNVSGHRIGTAEVESALVSFEHIAEAAVIGKPHDIKGQSIKGFVILINGSRPSDEMLKAVKNHVRNEIGAIGVPDEIEFVEKLPKTRSGKIMRRVLKAQELGTEIGDISTLED
jgi:acetyl-CoA synthetase